MADMDSWYADFQNSSSRRGVADQERALPARVRDQCHGPTSTSPAPATSARRRRMRHAGPPASPTRRSSSWPSPALVPGRARADPLARSAMDADRRRPGRRRRRQGARLRTGSRPAGRHTRTPRSGRSTGGRSRRSIFGAVALALLRAHLRRRRELGSRRARSGRPRGLRRPLVLLFATDLDQRLLPDVITLAAGRLTPRSSAFAGINPLVGRRLRRG